MTTAQWLFHYLEICHHQKRDFKWEIEKLRAGSSDIKRALKYLMIVTDPERGKHAVDAIEDEDKARYDNENGNHEASTNKKEKALSDDDQALWDWMQTTPETKALPQQVKDQMQERKFVVEAKSLADVAEDLGLIGINEETPTSDEVIDTPDESVEINDQQPAKEPMRIQSIGNIDEEQISLGFEIE